MTNTRTTSNLSADIPIDAITDTAHLTRIIINPGHPSARHDLRDIQRMHQTVTHIACPPGFGPSSRSAAGLLYRVEHTTAGATILIQSRSAIDTARIPDGYAHAGTRDLAPLLDALTENLPLQYRIHTNPTKQQFCRGSRGKLTPLTGDDALTWWHRKADESGLTLHAAHATHTAIIKGKRHGHNLALTTTTFEGTATIKNAETIKNSLLTGIGRGRAYGCGLLSLAPITHG